MRFFSIFFFHKQGTLNNFLQIRNFHEQSFQVGCDIQGETISITLLHYIHYADSNNDRNPFIIFDSMIIEQLSTKQNHDDLQPSQFSPPSSPLPPQSSSPPSSLPPQSSSQPSSIHNLLLDFSIPNIFGADDFLQHLSFEDRPPYQWLLLASARSGSPVKKKRIVFLFFFPPPSIKEFLLFFFENRYTFLTYIHFSECFFFLFLNTCIYHLLYFLVSIYIYIYLYIYLSIQTLYFSGT